ncbi:MAG TPA: MMPL family transporter, partial [Bacillota bacterium]|nr:MMPL family transporter [Bacillota bacterium]
MNEWLKKWWWLGLTALVALGICRLRFDVDVLNLLPPDLPSVQGIKLYQEHFANARELIITLRAPSGETAEALAAELAARLRRQTNLFTEVSWQPPWMEQPAQAAEIVAYLWFNQPPAVFGSLTNQLAPEHRGVLLGEAREALATSLSPMDIARRAFDPYDLLTLPMLTNFSGLSAEQGQQMFGSSDGTFRLLFVQARPALEGYQPCVSWLNEVRRTVEETRAQKPEWRETTLRYTGRPAFVAEIASSMQRDLSGSVVGTAVIIAALFWLTHRRWLPMLWLLTLLGLILVATLGLGSLLLGTINVVSLGFAAVLLGLAVDYAVVHYQEALAHPELTVPEIRRVISPSILWAAITTIAAFLVLNLGGLPGLAQLGSLVGIGVSLAALVMVVAFLPPLFPQRRHLPPGSPRFRFSAFLSPPPPEPVVWGENSPVSYRRSGLLVTGVVMVAAVAALSRGLPGVDRSGDALRLQHTEAEVALTEIAAAVGIPQDPLWAIAAGATEAEVYEQLCRAEALLAQASSNRSISGYLLPTSLWPRGENQEANRATAHWLAGEATTLREAALREGFNTNALFLTDELFQTWGRLGAGTGTH